MTALHLMLNNKDFDAHGKDWGTAMFLTAFGNQLPSERVKEIIEAAAKEGAKPEAKE